MVKLGRNSPCLCESGKKFKNCCINNGTEEKSFNYNSRAGRVLEVYQEIDTIVNNYKTSNPDHPCAIGCTECCSQIFLLHPEEYSLVQFGINELQNDTLNIISNKAKAYHSELIKQVNNYKDIFTNTKDATYLNVAIEKLKNIKIPCPFLIDDKCAIYNYRPVICRMYGFIHLYDENDGKVYWTSTCSKIATPINIGIPLPFCLVDIKTRTGIKSTPLPLIEWLIRNATGLLNIEILFNETVYKKALSPKLNHKKIIAYLTSKNIICHS